VLLWFLEEGEDMTVLKYVYILVSTSCPAEVLIAFRKKDSSAYFMLVGMMGYREATQAGKFLKNRMKPVDFAYWGKQNKALASKWLFKAAGSDSYLANDYSEVYNSQVEIK
jgi:hypothetical protein